jgi:outer membrane receptor protein involved in Fe transport
MKMKGTILSMVMVFVLLVSMPSSAVAQVATGTILGTVADPSGAFIPKSQVTATNLQTGILRKGLSDDGGRYAFEFLPIGVYRLEISNPGFKTFVQSGLVLEINQSVRLDVTLEVGAPSESVEVKAEAQQVNTVDASVGHTVSNEEILNLPLVNRNPYDFLRLTPGVQSNSNANNAGLLGQTTRVNGSSVADLTSSVGFSLDGGMNTSGVRETGNAVPNPDAIQEFRVETNSYSAEFGRYNGGMVDFVTKSGTNKLHGSLFDFVRNNALNASPWNLAPGTTQPALRRNQFGATIGGPIVKNRTFYFGSYSGLREDTTSVEDATVPTLLERQGNFSQSLNKPFKPGTNTRFANDIIPIDPLSLKILNQFVPAANAPNLGPNIAQSQVQTPNNSDQYLVKIDHKLTEAHQLSASYFYNKAQQISAPGSVAYSQQLVDDRQHNVTMGYTWVVSPKLVNQLRANYVRGYGARVNTPAISLGDLGSQYAIQGTPSLPQIGLSGYFTLSQTISGASTGSNFYGIKDVAVYSLGQHTLTFGAESSLEKVLFYSNLDNYGVFSFDGSKTKPLKTSLCSPACKGNALADFYLSLPKQFEQDAPTNKADDGWYYGLFAQDNYNVTKRLTLNLGLRYDLQLPFVDPHNQKLAFVPGKQSVVIAAAPLGLLFPGDPGVSRGIIPASKTHFSPRLGFALDPLGDRKTAIRGGFGLYYDSVGENEWDQSADRQPFAARQIFNNVKSLVNPYGNIAGGSPFPFVFSPANPRFILPASVTGINTAFQWPYTYQMNLSVQRQITPNTTATAAYVGSLTHRLPFVVDTNYPIFGPSATSNNVDQRRPIEPGTLSSVLLTSSIGNASYHSLQVSVEKRMSHNFLINGSYVYSKTLDTLADDGTAAQDMDNLGLERGRSDLDQRHAMVLSTVWNWNYFHGARILQQVLNGWTLSTITSIHSGSPFTVTSGQDNNLDGVNNDRPNLVGVAQLDPHRSRTVASQEWFNPAAFVANGTGQDGDAGRNILDAPGSKGVDVAFFRSFGFRERAFLQVRSEFTNFFNIVNLSAPNGSLNSANVGKITGAGTMRQIQLGLRLTF